MTGERFTIRKASLVDKSGVNRENFWMLQMTVALKGRRYQPTLLLEGNWHSH
ncbi:MAG: hypothetical protein ACUVTP_03720 [Candidatus Fervidibacter sp.]|uniref:hypothetical protein n=1 Tax=Candidatus Fervidibacter sp. TaxID=3100871 RepID=UPI00404A3018